MTEKTNLSRLEERPIDRKLAESIIVPYHYSGKIPSGTTLYLGYFMDEVLVGVITYGVGVSAHQIDWVRKINPSFTQDNFRELTRLCILPDYQVKNLASRMVGKSIRYIEKNCPDVKVLISFADTNQTNPDSVRHMGYVYQATNWHYVGEGGRGYKVTVNGEEKHNKWVKNKDLVGVDGGKVEKVLLKKKYIYLIADGKTKREWLSHVKTLPYPKDTRLSDDSGTYYEVQDWDSEDNWDFKTYESAQRFFDKLTRQGYTNLRLRQINEDGDEEELLDWSEEPEEQIDNG